MTRYEEQDREFYQNATSDAIKKTERIAKMLRIMQQYKNPTWDNGKDMDEICGMLQQVIDQLELDAFFMG